VARNRPADALRPRFSDARLTMRWVVGLVLPLFTLTLLAALLLPRPEPALAVGGLGAGSIVVVATVGVLFGRPPRVRSA
jgi:hypothetical protein